MRRIWILTALLFACPSPDQKAPPPPPIEKQDDGPDWTKAIDHSVRWDGEKKSLVVDVKIQPGFHAYTTGETIGKPLAIALDEKSAYALAGDVHYPEGITKDLPVGRSVIVEGSTQIVAPIQKKEGATGTQASGVFKWQVCTAEACDRPRTKEFAIEVPN